MRSDGPSVPTRGSRFVGLLSMIITRVCGSGRCEQDRLQKLRKTPVRKRTILDTGFVKGASGIRDFSQYRRLLGAGGGRNVRGPLVPRFIREQGEGCALFGCWG